MSLSNKVAIITGASSGIGAATAILFAREGAKVVGVGRNEANLQNVAEKCSQVGEKALVIVADITNDEEVVNVVKKTVEVFGRVDVLVNNAGIWRPSPIDGQNSDVFDEVFNTNLKAAVMLTNVAVPHLIKTKGNIVNVSSVLGTKALPGYSIYCASKAALDHFTKVTATELATKGVRVNAVSPGPVETNLFKAAGDKIPVEALKSLTALHKLAKPEEIAELIAYVASDRASSATGSNLVMDCGTLLK